MNLLLLIFNFLLLTGLVLGGAYGWVPLDPWRARLAFLLGGLVLLQACVSFILSLASKKRGRRVSGGAGELVLVLIAALLIEIAWLVHIPLALGLCGVYFLTWLYRLRRRQTANLGFALATGGLCVGVAALLLPAGMTGLYEHVLLSGTPRELSLQELRQTAPTLPGYVRLRAHRAWPEMTYAPPQKNPRAGRGRLTVDPPGIEKTGLTPLPELRLGGRGVVGILAFPPWQDRELGGEIQGIIYNMGGGLAAPRDVFDIGRRLDLSFKNAPFLFELSRGYFLHRYTRARIQNHKLWPGLLLSLTGFALLFLGGALIKKTDIFTDPTYESGEPEPEDEIYGGLALGDDYDNDYDKNNFDDFNTEGAYETPSTPTPLPSLEETPGLDESPELPEDLSLDPGPALPEIPEVSETPAELDQDIDVEPEPDFTAAPDLTGEADLVGETELPDDMFGPGDLEEGIDMNAADDLAGPGLMSAPLGDDELDLAGLEGLDLDLDSAEALPGVLDQEK